MPPGFCPGFCPRRARVIYALCTPCNLPVCPCTGPRGQPGGILGSSSVRTTDSIVGAHLDLIQFDSTLTLEAHLRYPVPTRTSVLIKPRCHQSSSKLSAGNEKETTNSDRMDRSHGVVFSMRPEASDARPQPHVRRARVCEAIMLHRSMYASM